MAGLALAAVKKTFGNTAVICGIDLEVADHEFLVFVGPSGCGKSTLLRMIAGLETTSSGVISIGDRDVTFLPPFERNIAMVFQSYALYPHMTVEENMSFGLKANGVPAEEINTLITSAAKSLQLEDYLKRKPAALSGGQRQRVAIGRAIVRKPQIFLFDEPLSNLDAELRVYMRIEIARLHKKLGATMIYVTHDQVEAMTLADRIVVLQSGKIEQVGSPLALFDNPDNQFVAGFLGSPRMNFLPAKVISINDASITFALSTVGRQEITLPLHAEGITQGETLTLGVRPEHLTFTPTEGAQLNLVCDVIEQMGEISNIYTQTESGDQLVIELRNNRSKKDGDDIQVYVPVEKALIFKADGKRVR